LFVSVDQPTVGVSSPAADDLEQRSGLDNQSFQEPNMRVLLAEDDLFARRALKAMLVDWHYEVLDVPNGAEALAVLASTSAPRLAVLDWMMPEMDGVEVCRQVRRLQTAAPPYLLLVTANASKDQVALGLEAGADDYITKPFDPRELHARLQVGCRIVELQSKLAERVYELEMALSQVKQLQGLLPICCYCKKIRDDSNYWQQVEAYLSKHANARFSHGICPDCYENIVVKELERWQSENSQSSAT
jgi:CheY-like chemotaxis protein